VFSVKDCKKTFFHASKRLAWKVCISDTVLFYYVSDGMVFG